MSTVREFREVGQRWLTSIPADWETSPLRYLCDIGTGSGDTLNAEPDGEYPFVVRSPNLLRATTYDHDGEAILTVGDGAVGEVFHHLFGKFLAHQRVYVLNNFRRIQGRFLFYYFSALFRIMAQDGSARTTVDSVRRWMLTDMPIAIPPPEEQRAIADYLDRETARIDALITKQEQLIRKLAERRRVIIDSVITQGIDAHVDFFDSGVDWIGRLPVGWSIRPLWTMFKRIKDIGHPEEQMLSVFRDFGVVAKDSRDNINRTAENRNIYQLVHPGWLVTNRMKAWQGSVGISSLRGIVSGHYLCFAPTHSEDNDYLNWLFRSPRYAIGYGLLSRGVRIGQAEIDNDDYQLMPVVLPPLREQRQIAEYLNEQTSKIDLLIEKTRAFIALVKERRSALITAVVTGQIDAREAAWSR